jgi:pSer/pThr/pTyr-binding forkhead associated (FHA) protein
MWGRLALVGGSDASICQNEAYDLKLEENSFGRTTDNTFTVNKPYVSGKHFTLTKGPDSGPSHILNDHSSNGTFLNGCLVGRGKTQSLEQGDRISLKFRGTDKLVFEFSAITNQTNQIAATSENDPPVKYQRLTGTKRSADSIDEQRNESPYLTRIAALERENQQQEIRIGNYITKLESTAREVGNLQRELQISKDRVKEKDNELTDAKQNRWEG